MTHESDLSRDFVEWRRSPDRSVAGALVGLILAWVVGALLLAAMVTLAPATASVSGREFVLVMVVPVVASGTACLSRRVRYWGGAVVPGVTAGWCLGLLTFAGPGLLAMAT